MRAKRIVQNITGVIILGVLLIFSGCPPIVITKKADEHKKIDGFRIQLFSSKNLEMAQQEKNKAELLFSEKGVKVHMEFNSPLYKIRVGDFRDREDAEVILEFARQNQYTGAWIVKAKVEE